MHFRNTLKSYVVSLRQPLPNIICVYVAVYVCVCVCILFNYVETERVNILNQVMFINKEIQIIKINTNTINSKNYWTYGQGHKCGEADILLL